MSVGNLKTEGQKGNNFPWQLKMLQGFTSMINVLLGNTVGATKITTILRPTASGTITAGKTSISISNVGTANGSVSSITLKPCWVRRDPIISAIVLPKVEEFPVLSMLTKLAVKIISSGIIGGVICIRSLSAAV